MKQITLILLLAFQLLPLAAQKMIDMNKKLLYLCAMLWAAVLLNGCAKDEQHHTPHPDRGAVKITTDWAGLSTDATRPESYLLRIGSEEQTVSDETNVFNSLFLPGQSSLLVYHQAEGITIDNTTATINLLPDETLHPMPGYLFSAAQELDIVADDTLKVTVVMKQHTRSLALILKLNPGDEQRIAATKAALTGIAPSIDLTTGSVVAAKGATIAPLFILRTDNTTTRTDNTVGTPILSASLRLLGMMAGEENRLTLAVTLTNGTVQTIVTDLTEALKNFGSGEPGPLALDAILTLPAESDISATISHWNVVNNGDITVN